MFKPETIADKGLTEKLTPIVDEAVRAERAKQPSRSYPGASRWGEACERRLAYEYHKTNPRQGIQRPGATELSETGHDARGTRHRVSATCRLQDRRTAAARADR
jgi:hypothetical protein